METHDPFAWFGRWLEEARAHAGIAEPTAMILSTSDDGQPDARVLLLKDFDHRGFVFYSNLQSRKGSQLAANPHVSMLFFWMPLGYQVRIQGSVVPVSDAEADAYFASRPRGSQVGAWASKQSQPLASREELMERVAKYEKQFDGIDVPRPPHWSGFRLVPESIEFWQAGEYRLHDRHRFTRAHDGWKVERLYP